MLIVRRFECGRAEATERPMAAAWVVERLMLARATAESR